MHFWFNCRIRYSKELPDGKIQKVTEQYLVDTMSFTEAEVKLTEELADLGNDFQILSVGKSYITDVFDYGDSDIWYRLKLTYIDVDPETHKEKKTTKQMLVNASNIKEAYERLHESLSNMVVPFRVIGIVESPFKEVFPYKQKSFAEHRVEEEGFTKLPENVHEMEDTE